MRRHLLLKRQDLLLHLHRQADVIKAINKAMFPELFDIEGADFVARCVVDDLIRKIDLDFAAGGSFGGDGVEVGFVGDGDGEHAVFEGVVEEDVSVGRCDDTLDAKVEESPWGVLTR